MKNKVINIMLSFLLIIMVLSNFSYATELNTQNKENEDNNVTESIKVPEININLKIKNLTRGCKTYILLPENLLKYNMEKFINNNLENPYALQAQEARKLKEFMDSEDYLGYIEHFKEAGFEVADNEIELRHYCFCLGKSEVIEYSEYNGTKYVKIEINLNDEKEFKVILKDYLTKYDVRDIKFLIVGYGDETYIDLTAVPYTTNQNQSNITECNITHTFSSDENFEEIERAIDTTYLIIYIILIILAIVILILLIKKHLKKKQEIEDRKFWKKKLTKEEKKAEKKRLKEEKKNLKNKKLKEK